MLHPKSMNKLESLASIGCQCSYKAQSASNVQVKICCVIFNEPRWSFAYSLLQLFSFAKKTKQLTHSCHRLLNDQMGFGLNITK